MTIFLVNFVITIFLKSFVDYELNCHLKNQVKQNHKASKLKIIYTVLGELIFKNFLGLFTKTSLTETTNINDQTKKLKHSLT